MATKMLIQRTFGQRAPSLLKNLLPSTKKLHHIATPTKEIKIPVKWGHISGKLWGSENQRPILAIHGWQDNAGTWDPVAAELVKGCSILAIDLPGHGFSSWFPPGTNYYAWEWPRIIYYIKEHFKWDKITLLCHSMGAIAGLRYSSLFSDTVDTFVAIDSLIYDDYDLDFAIENYKTNIRKSHQLQTRIDKEPPSYPMDELKKIWHLGTKKSIALETVHHLCERGTKQSKIDPNKYYFSRDGRLKHILFNLEDKKFVEALISRVKCPTLYIKAKESPYSSDAFSIEMRELLAKINNDYEFQMVSGTHHLHLNNPEIVVPLIKSFLIKYNLYTEN